MQSIIEAAESAGASLVVTPCPMCQFNLEVNQLWINQTCGSSFNLPVLFFTQLICVAFGLGPAADLNTVLFLLTGLSPASSCSCRQASRNWPPACLA